MEKITITIDNFDFICRTCLCDIKETDSLDLFNSLIHESTISDVLMKHTSLQIDKEDNLPKRLCQQCHMNLIHCQEFLNKCKESEETLQAILMKREERITIKMEEIDEPLEQEIIVEDPLKDCPQQQQPINIVRTDAGDMSHVCDTCSKCFSQKRYLDEHKRRVHPSEKKSHVCDICSKCYSRKRYLVEHKRRMHPVETSYGCDICSKRFARKEYILVHKRLVHKMERPHVCEICSKRFAAKHLLRAHMTVHTNVMPYNCDICSRGFALKHTLVAHMRTHTSDKPYVCDICSKGFSQQRYLTYHKVSHTGEKRYVCDICSKGFPYKSGLKYHMLSHTGYVCRKCCKGFQDDNRTHSGKKRFTTCKNCEATPKNDSDSAEEIEDKTQTLPSKIDLELTDIETEYVCSDCGECFNLESDLKSHLLSHNEEKPIKCNDYDEISKELELKTDANLL